MFRTPPVLILCIINPKTTVPIFKRLDKINLCFLGYIDIEKLL